MTADTAEATAPSRWQRGRMAFRRWRRSRPFWGGLLMIVSGLLLFLSGNLDLGNVQIHLGVTGFLSYIVPAFMVLCGALVWATPAQRIFYGVLGTIAAIYSLISVNLGGFVLGFLFGIIGGGLTMAWVPIKRQPVAIPSQRDGDPDGYPSDGTEEIDYSGRHAMADVAEEDGTEGKQGARFRFPRHATPGHAVTAAFATRPRTPRLVITSAIALTLLGAIGVATLRDPQAAAAAGCALPPASQLRSSAKAAAAKPTKAAAAKPTQAAAKPTGVTTKPPKIALGDARLASVQVAAAPSPGPDPISGLIGGILGVLTGATPSASPSTPPTAGEPTTAPPSPTKPPAPTKPPTPTGAPTTAAGGQPSKSANPSASPIGGRPTTHPTATSPSPSCDVIAKHLNAASDQSDVQNHPGTMTAGTLTMTGLSYDGNVDLPTKNGTIEVMQFSMDSSTSTPFELDVTTNGKTMQTKSSSLTVSGNVKFYATEIKGNVLGILPADYTPDNPPPIVPPLLFFTNVTIGLEEVVCDKLTAPDLKIN